MAARTFTSAGTDNLWSNPANWDGGTTIPADGDSVTIPSGQTCEYDYNSAYTTGIAGITVTGTFKLTRTAGTYRLFMKAATTIAGAGTFDCGTVASPIPFAAKHTITGGAAWYVNGASGLTMTVYAAEPVIKYITIVGTEAVGQTVLSVAQDVTGEANYWKDGDIVRINDAKKRETEERTIAVGGVASNTITITAGLTRDKAEGSVIVLISRNVKFINTRGDQLKSFLPGKLTIAGGSFTAPSGTIVNCTSTISGGVFYNASFGASGAISLSGGVFCALSTGVSANYSTINGGVFTACNHAIVGRDLFITGGVFTCLNNCFYTSYVINIIGGSFIKCAKLCELCTGVRVFNTELVDCTQALNTTEFTLYNSKISAATIINYASFNMFVFSESIDHDQVAGAYKAWTKGGVTTKQAVVYPVGYTYSMQTVLENATVEGYWQKEVTVGAGASINIALNLRKDASMVYLPRIIIFNKASTDPFAGGTPLKTFTMTDSIDTWEADSYTYTNTGTADVALVIRCQGKNATGSMYSYVDVDVINVDLTSALAKLDAIKAKTDTLKNPSLLIDGEIIV